MYDGLVDRLRNLSHLEIRNAESVIHVSAEAVTGIRGIAHEAANAIEELTARDTNVPSWIPVTERLPEQGKRYLVARYDYVTETPFIDILWHDAHDLWWNRLYKGNCNVTHWMPLPEPPKED